MYPINTHTDCNLIPLFDFLEISLYNLTEDRGYSGMGLMGHFQFAFATRHACTCKGKKPTIVVDLNRGGWIKLKVQACCFKRHFRWPDKLYGLWTRSVHKQKHKFVKDKFETHNSLLKLNNIHKYRYHIFWSWRLLNMTFHLSLIKTEVWAGRVKGDQYQSTSFSTLQISYNLNNV